MLEIKNIKKDYQLKDQEPVHALKGISINFRENEFVAILGHSGCGKTTLLNIIGGLDHYDEGDLIIKGTSTKNFTDYDWDTYRNHSIGFVFQTYNLISHQTILKNVELALTISGIKKEERIQRAKDALDAVGLKDLYSKKPNQMSGGQMQRVAIARALVNNPEIVLADEPTGALDSETSVQIMDILKEVAKNHLVIMVTHNPELAETYATRIIRMKDGLLLSDSNPYKGSYTAKEVKEEQKQSAMSFVTATSLSISNLWSKIKRTVLVAVAGSIGIIGVSTILGVSVGVNNFIDDMQNDMLSRYPIGIAEETMELSTLLTGLSNQETKELPDFDVTTSAGMDSMIAYLLSRYSDLTNMKSNDINDDLMKFIEDMPKDYYSALTYDYNIDPTNNIFTSFREKKGSEEYDIISTNGLTKRYTETLMTVKGFENYLKYVDLFTNFMKELPKEEDYIMEQYDLIAGKKYAMNDDELLLVVDANTTLTDLVYAQLGYYPQDEFLNISKKAVKSNEAYKQYINNEITEAEYKDLLKKYDEKYKYESSFTFEDILKKDFYYYPHDVIYRQNPDFVSHKQVVTSISGIDEDNNRYILSLSYVAAEDSLTGTYIVLDSSNMIVNNEYCMFTRMGNRDTSKSVMDGNWIGGSGKSLTNITSIIQMSLKTTNATTSESTTYYDVDTSSIIKVASDPISIFVNPTIVNVDSGKVTEVEPVTPDYYYEAYANRIEYNGQPLDKQDISKIPNAKKMNIVGILRAKPNVNFGTLSRGVYYSHAFAEKYIDDSSNSEIVQTFKKHIKDNNFLLATFNAYVRFKYDSYEKDDGSESFVPEVKEGFTSCLNGDMTQNMMSVFFSFLGSNSNNLDVEKTHLRSLCGLKIVEVEEDKYDTSLLPESISIYPKDFKKKNSITSYLDKWNSEDTIVLTDGTEISPDRNELTYNDTISIIIVVISRLVNVISAALISFTSLSLVVSCFMIAVITYISVMERVKEIGVIRSLGGRKKDVSRLFVAENLITGFASGTIGIIVTYILQIIINLIVKRFGVIGICALPWYYALMMIGIAVGLSVLSGLIPSMSASKQDPVIALRTE